MTLTRHTLAAALAAALLATSMSAHADKKADIQKIVSLQQGAVDDLARGVAERPAMQMVGTVRQIIVQAVPEEKREDTAKQVDTEIRKYVDGATAVTRASAAKVAQPTLTAAFDERFTEEELKQLAVILDSPVLKKYQGLVPELSNAVVEKILADARPQLEQKVKATETSIRGILEKATSAPQPAKPAAKPAPKK